MAVLLPLVINGKFGDVPTITPADIGKALTVNGGGTGYTYSAFATSADVATAIASHVAAADPHTQYLLDSQYTAADVLAKLLTVDGSGSGLDADLLEGNSSAAFALASHTHGGGGGTPGGSVGQVQIHGAGGVFVGDAGLTYDIATDVLTLAGRLVTPKWSPAADSTTAIQVTKADGTTAVMTVDTTNSRVGIGGTPTSKFHVADTLSVNHGSAYNTFNQALTVSAAQTGAITGASATVTVTNTTGAIATVIGQGATATQLGAGTATNVYGAQYLAQISNNAGPTTNLYGFLARSTHFNTALALSHCIGAAIYARSNGGAVTTLRALECQVENFGAANITTAYGIWIRLPRKDDTGNFTNVYGLYVDDQTGGGSTTSYAIYTNAGKVRFGDNVGVLNDPTAALDAPASTTARASLRKRLGVRPTTPNHGDGWNDGADVIFGEDAVTNTIVNGLKIERASTGTPAAGFGVSIAAQLESSTTVDQAAGRLTYEWIVATHASRAARGKLSAYSISTEQEAIRWDGDGGGVKLGFYGVTAVARQLLATGAGATVDQVITALQNLGLLRQS